jgi:citrate lyase beta subunit
VVPAHKAAARESASASLRALDFRGAERLVRINPLETGLALDDLTITMAGHPDGYVIRLRADDVRFIDRALSNLEALVGRAEDPVNLVLLAGRNTRAILNIAASRATLRTT